MNKVCQSCSSDFTIEPDDFAFYEKIDVPAPTFCPGCRRQRRLAFWNLIHLYKRNCDLTNKPFISMYHPDTPHTIYSPSAWWSDDWDAADYGRDYDFEKPFFVQFNELLHQVPLVGLSLNADSLVTSPYANHAHGLKNCYLLFQAAYSEDCAYGFYVKRSQNCYDCSRSGNMTNCYDSVHLYTANGCVGCKSCFHVIDCYFCRDCTNSQNCFGSSNLHNKQYYIFNEPYSKEEYFAWLNQQDLGSYSHYQSLKSQAEENWKRFTPRPTHFDRSQDCTGNHVFQSANCHESYQVTGSENCKYLLMVSRITKDSHDISSWGENMELCYEGTVVGVNSSMLKFCWEGGIDSARCEYSKLAMNCEDCFGCVSLRKKKYCILNKQYTESEYTDLLLRIKDHMNTMPYKDVQGNVYRYGEFFPTEISPFAYRDSVAQTFYPLSPEQVQQNGYTEYPEIVNEHAITMDASELSDHIKDTPDSITQEIIRCSVSGKGYRITESELAFHRQYNFPLPRVAPMERLEAIMREWADDLTLVERESTLSGEKFMTPFTREQAPIIYSPEEYRREIL